MTEVRAPGIAERLASRLTIKRWRRCSLFGKQRGERLRVCK